MVLLVVTRRIYAVLEAIDAGTQTPNDGHIELKDLRWELEREGSSTNDDLFKLDAACQAIEERARAQALGLDVFS